MSLIINSLTTTKLIQIYHENKLNFKNALRK